MNRGGFGSRDQVAIAIKGHPFQFRVDLIQLAGRLEHVEMTVARDLVADLRLVVVDPCVGNVRHDFSPEIRFDVFAQRNVFAVSQFRVGLGLDFAFALVFLDDFVASDELDINDSEQKIVQAIPNTVAAVAKKLVARIKSLSGTLVVCEAT